MSMKGACRLAVAGGRRDFFIPPPISRNGATAQFWALANSPVDGTPDRLHYKVLGRFDGPEAETIRLTVPASHVFVRNEPKPGILHQYPGVEGSASKDMKVLAASAGQYLVEYQTAAGARRQTIVAAKHVLLSGQTEVAWSKDGAVMTGKFVRCLQEGDVYQIKQASSGADENVLCGRVSVVFS